MKSLFSTTWKSSVQPRKQRKYLANAPNHLQQKQLSVNLDKDLRKKYGMRSIEVRKNDEVKIMRGKFKKKQGKVLKVDYKYTKVQVEGIEIKKGDGESTLVWLRPSNLKIIKLDDSDKRRMKRTKKTTTEKTETKKTKTEETKK
jgi:large subunit ribosomal protein L24